MDFSDIIHRIDAIRTLHDQLQFDSSGSEVHIGPYFSAILKELFRSLSPEPVELTLSVPEVTVTPRLAVPLGIIVNELATNAVKHGFGESRSRRFTLKLELEGEVFVLTVRNSGTPFPEELAIENTESLGMRIILGLVAQIGGSFDLQRSPETTIKIRFPRENPLA